MIIDLVWQAVQSTGGVTTGNYTFTDPYDPRVGVLLCPDVDGTLISFKVPFSSMYFSSLCTLTSKNDQAVFHLFRNSTLFREDHFTPTALRMEGAPTTINLDEATTEVIQWHYKHAVIRSWSGTSFASLLQTFPVAVVDLVAWSTDDSDDESEYSDDSY
jgi:hypothetical protein